MVPHQYVVPQPHQHSDLRGVRQAIHTLYTSPDSGQRRTADRYLSRFQSTPGSWRVCLQLLDQPNALEQEKYFAATTLRTVCQKYHDILHQQVAAELPGQLAMRVRTLLEEQQMVPMTQLAAALGALVVRSHVWHPPHIVPGIKNLLVPASVDPITGMQLLDPTHLAVLLHCWAAVAEAAASKQVVVGTERRGPVTEALLASPWVCPMVAAAIGTQSPALVQLGCQLVCRWCDLGAAPLGLETRPDVLEVAAVAVLQPALNEVASEFLVLLLASCKDKAHQAPSNALLQHLLHLLQSRLLPTLTAQQAALGLASPCAVLGQQMGEKAEIGFCRIMAAAAGALLKPAWQQGGQSLVLMQALQERLLLHVTDMSDGVALAALDFWQASYLEPIKALPEQVRLGVVAQQQGVLLSLASAVVRRTQLTPAAAQNATADARDLPEEFRTVRREMANALRDITQLLGLQTMLGAVTRLVTQYWQHLAPAVVPGPGGFGGLGVSGMLPSASGSGGALSSGPSSSRFPWLELECAMYAANVVLGKASGSFPPGVQEDLGHLTQLAAAAVTHPSGSMKLSGTCLTLLGGLAPWFVQQPHKLPPLLSCMSAALKAADEKLVRNAATCVQRLSLSDELCTLLVQQQATFVASLVQEYHSRGGLQMRAGQGDDMSTEELLLLSLCNMAVAAADVSGLPDQLESLLLQLAAPQLTAAVTELQEASRLLTAAGAAAAAGVGDALVSVEMQLQPVQQQAIMNACSRAICSFRSLTTLVSGLPTKLPKGATTLTLKMCSKLAPANTQPDASPQQQQYALKQQQQQQQQQMMAQQQWRPDGLHMLLDPGSAGMYMGAADAAGSMDNTRHRLGNHYSSHHGSPAAASRNSVDGITGTTAAAAAGAAGAGPRELQARWLTSQLVAYSWHLVQLTRQVLAASYQNLRLPGQLPGAAEQLLVALCDFLSGAVPGAARARGKVTPGSHSGTDLSPIAQVQAVQRLVVQVMQEVLQLPEGAIQMPCCMQLLGVVLSTLGAQDLGSWAADGRSILSGQQLRTGGAGGSDSGEPVNQQQQEADQLLSLQMLSMLQEQMQKALGANCSILLTQDVGRAEPHHVATTLLLTTAAVQRTPCVLAQVVAGPTGEQLLTLVQAAASSYHLEQCNAVLACIQALMAAPYTTQAQPEQLQLMMSAAGPADGSGSSSNGVAGDAAAPAVLAVAQGRAGVLGNLRSQLEAGWAGRLVLSLLMAASGQMPPDLVVQVSACLHSIWQAVGDTLFGTWLDLAVVHLAPEHAVWFGLRHQQKVMFLQQLMEPACIHDTTRFRKVLKAFCTGKRKGR